jgi:hypothetical protein
MYSRSPRNRDAVPKKMCPALGEEDPIFRDDLFDKVLGIALDSKILRAVAS